MGKEIDKNSLRWRMFKRFRLDHITAKNAPFFTIIKSGLAVFFSILIDRYTQNPDTVTAAFTSLLVITGELAVPGWRIGKEILLAAIVGSIWGSIFNFMFIATELNPNLGSWLSLVRVPLGVMATIYTLLFFNKPNPTPQTSGFFSAVFVQLVFYEYPPFSNNVGDFPTKLIISTLITRIIAVSEGAVIGVLVNFIISSPFTGRIFKYRLYYAEKIAWTNFGQFLHDTVEFQSLQAYFMMTDLLKDLREAERDEILSNLSSKNKKSLGEVEGRVCAMIRLLNFQGFLSFYQQTPGLTDEELVGLRNMLSLSRLTARGDLPYDRSFEDEIQMVMTSIPPSLQALGKMLLYSLEELQHTAIKYDKKPKRLIGIV